jgi:hypothetical protein
MGKASPTFIVVTPNELTRAGRLSPCCRLMTY